MGDRLLPLLSVLRLFSFSLSAVSAQSLSSVSVAEQTSFPASAVAVRYLPYSYICYKY